MPPARVLVTSAPFGVHDRRPLDLLDAVGAEYVINPHGQKLTEEQLAALIPGFDIVIAGTEPITARVLARADRLRLISRVGIGLDSVDLLTARERGIAVAYTPDAPAAAVAELTLGMMLSLLRHIHTANDQIHARGWQRLLGRRIGELTVGIIGVGRVGSRVLQHLRGFSPRRVVANDLVTSDALAAEFGCEWVSKAQLLEQADIVSLHVPLTAATRNLLRREQLLAMKPDAIVVNTSRGGIINEADLDAVLSQGHLAGAAVDVFEKEPYAGPLTQNARCLLTAHMGSMSADCRSRMEMEATEAAVAFIGGESVRQPVPQAEYDIQSQQLSAR